jgi:hypothetical protein
LTVAEDRLLSTFETANINHNYYVKEAAMITLTTKILTTTNTADRTRSFETGYADGLARRPDKTSPTICATHRASLGFKQVAADMLTPPDANHKLEMASIYTYGLTLAHANLTEWNACPWAGHCTKVCVLNNGNGRYSSVQNAWRWRTAFLAQNPLEALYRIGWELGRAIRIKGEILFRPNVNSDLLWHKIIPTLGQIEQIHTYGYTKNPAVLNTDGVIGGLRYAYSLNENSNVEKVRAFLNAGGTVAVVTNRKPKTSIDKDMVRNALSVCPSINVIDADVTDEWMFVPGTIGDLSAKGKARDLIGNSGFILCAY